MDRGREGGMDLHIYEWREQRAKPSEEGLEEMPGMAQKTSSKNGREVQQAQPDWDGRKGITQRSIQLIRKIAERKYQVQQDRVEDAYIINPCRTVAHIWNPTTQKAEAEKLAA